MIQQKPPHETVKKKPAEAGGKNLSSLFLFETEIFVFVFNPGRNFGVVFSRTTDRLDSPITKYM